MKPEEPRGANPQDGLPGDPDDQHASISDPDVLDPALEASGQSLHWLERLCSLASEGDSRATNLLHRIACQLTDRLNEDHYEFAEGVNEWPVVMSADREKRKEQASEILRKSIGGIQAMRKGRPVNYDYESERGFAVANLIRLAEARSLLKMLRFCEDEQNLDEPTGAAFGTHTKIQHHDHTLLTSIALLPDYSGATREEWIDVLVAILKANPQLVPEARSDSSVTIHNPPARLKGKIPSHREWRGGLLIKALRRALQSVDAVPGFPEQ